MFTGLGYADRKDRTVTILPDFHITENLTEFLCTIISSILPTIEKTRLT